MNAFKKRMVTPEWDVEHTELWVVDDFARQMLVDIIIEARDEVQQIDECHAVFARFKVDVRKTMRRHERPLLIRWDYRVDELVHGDVHVKRACGVFLLGHVRRCVQLATLYHGLARVCNGSAVLMCFRP